MTNANYIGAIVVAAIAVIILVIKVIMDRKKSGSQEPISFDAFIAVYGGQIIDALENVVSILQININEFSTKEDYEKAIISTTIDMLKQDATEFGIDQKVINLFSTESLTEAVYEVFNDNKVVVYSTLESDDITSKPELYDEESIAVLTEATGEETEENE